MKRRAALSSKEPASKRIRSLTPAQSIATTQLIKREMKKNIDVKYTDVSSILQNVSSSGLIQSCLANLVRGDSGLNNFNGNTITPIGLTVNFGCQTDQNYNFVRVMVIQWLDSGTPVLSGLLATTVSGSAPFSGVLVTNRKEIRVLSDTTFAVAPTAAAGTTTVLGNGHFTKKIFIPGRKIQKIRFQSGADTCQHGNIYVVSVSDDSLVSYPQLTFFSRLSFSD